MEAPTATVLALISVALLSPTVVGAQRETAAGGTASLGEVGSAFEQLRDILVQGADSTERSRKEVVGEIVRLGPRSIPTLFSVYTGEGLERLMGPETVSESDAQTSWWCRPDSFGGLALEALAALPAKQVLEHLEGRIRSSTPVEIQLAAIRVVGAVGSPRGLQLWVRAADGMDPLALRYRSVRTNFQGALARMVAGDPRVYTALEDGATELPDEILELVVASAQDAERPEAARLLMSAAGRNADLDARIMDTLSALELRYPWRMTVDPRLLVRESLGSEHTALRRTALVNAGRLFDLESFDALLAAVESSNPAVRQSAHWAFVHWSGEKQIEDAEQWASWMERELSFQRDRMPELREELRSGIPARAVQAARELCEHPVFRHQNAAEIAALLQSYDPDVAALFCDMLGHLGSAEAVPQLVDLLFEAPPGLREPVARALAALTGRRLPPEPWIWEKYVNG